MSVVRPEFGPTLPELLGPRLGWLPRPARLGAAALVAVVVLGWIAWSLTGGGDGRERLVLREPIAFNLSYTAGLRRVPAQAGEVLRLQTPASASSRQSYAVRPLRLERYRGDVNGALAVLASRLVDRMREEIPGFVWRGDGRVSVNQQPGYQISYQTEIDGQTTYGRRVLLMPDEEAPTVGVDVSMLAQRSGMVPSVAAVGGGGLLRIPYRSLRFGTEGP